jgi:hypothetical protein
MDYFQGVVAEYLRADRSTFINPEFCLQLDGGVKAPSKGSFWYIDPLAVSFGDKTAYLCEVSYAKAAAALINRLAAWRLNWPRMLEAVRRDADVPADWVVRPWLFVPEIGIKSLVTKLPPLPTVPRITPLEMTEPWRYCGWDRQGEAPKPDTIPSEMQA